MAAATAVVVAAFFHFESLRIQFVSLQLNVVYSQKQALTFESFIAAHHPNVIANEYKTWSQQTANSNSKNDKNSSNFKIIAFSIKMMMMLMMVIFGETKHENWIVMIRHYNCDKVHAILLSESWVELRWIEFIHLKCSMITKRKECNKVMWCDGGIGFGGCKRSQTVIQFKRIFIYSIEMS